MFYVGIAVLRKKMFKNFALYYECCEVQISTICTDTNNESM